ncbi:MAG: sucrase ferredoxin [Oligoflexales bacterium]
MNENQYCSLLTKNHTPSIIGTAGYKPCQIFIEFAQPWNSNVIGTPGFPEGVDVLLKKLMRQYKVPISLNSMCRESKPNKEASHLFILYSKPGDKCAYSFFSYEIALNKVESFLTHLLPDIFDNGITYQSDAFRKKRAVMICCHGERDRCCGKFGLDLFNHMNRFTIDKKLPIDVWKSSHIGGHKYAPTLMDLPSMRVWGHLSNAEAESLLVKDQFNTNLLKRYRGFCSLSNSYEQFAESEALKKFAWEWLDRDDFRVCSDWQKSSDDAKGQVNFYRDSEADSVFRCMVSQSGTYESQASCFKSEKKSIPIYSKV